MAIVGIRKISPPIVGVPSFFLCVSPTNTEILCPNLNFFNTGIINNPKTADASNPIIAAKIAFVSNSMYVTPFSLIIS